MDTQAFEEYHVDSGLGELDTESILNYLAQRTKNELEHYKGNAEDVNETVVALLEGVITGCEHAAFEYYASTK